MGRFNKVEMVSGHLRHLEFVLDGPKRALELTKTYLNQFLAIVNGYSKQLADTYARKQEAEAEIVEEKANQEKLRTINEAIKTAERVALLEHRFPGMTNQILTQYLTPLAETMVDHRNLP